MFHVLLLSEIMNEEFLPWLRQLSRRTNVATSWAERWGSMISTNDSITVLTHCFRIISRCYESAAAADCLTRIMSHCLSLFMHSPLCQHWLTLHRSLLCSTLTQPGVWSVDGRVLQLSTMWPSVSHTSMISSPAATLDTVITYVLHTHSAQLTHTGLLLLFSVFTSTWHSLLSLEIFILTFRAFMIHEWVV